MTVNLFCVTNSFAVVVADRRLSYGTGKIASDRATKIINIACQNARLIGAFNGYVGNNENNTPLNWLEREGGLANLPLSAFLEKTKEVLEAGLRGQRSDVARLSLTMAGYLHHAPVLCHISNYETLDSNANPASHAGSEMHIQRFDNDFICAQTGYYPKEKGLSLRRTFEALQKDSANMKRIKKELLKAARDVPFADSLEGSVGPNCHSVVLTPNGGFENGLETIGGTSVLEYPSYIGAGGAFSEIMVDTNPSKDGPAWGHPLTRKTVRLGQRTCNNPKCKNPIPVGQNRCAVCGEQLG